MFSMWVVGSNVVIGLYSVTAYRSVNIHEHGSYIHSAVTVYRSVNTTYMNTVHIFIQLSQHTGVSTQHT